VGVQFVTAIRVDYDIEAAARVLGSEVLVNGCLRLVVDDLFTAKWLDQIEFSENKGFVTACGRSSSWPPPHRG
jgi:hypothetical protein